MSSITGKSFSLSPLELQLQVNDEGWTDRQCKGRNGSNKNFTVVSSYAGSLTREMIEKGLEQLTQVHPYLRTTIKINDQVHPVFVELEHYKMALVEYPYKGGDQWEKVAKENLRSRFDKDHEPLWRLTFLKGEGHGEIWLTFHHAIADGIAGLELMNSLYETLSAQLVNQPLQAEIGCSTPLPHYTTLYPLIKQHPQAQSGSSEIVPNDANFHTGLARRHLSRSVTKKAVLWSTQHKVTVHSTLFAVLIEAMVSVGKLPDEKIEALSVVNLRPYYSPAVSRKLLRSLYTCLSSPLNLPLQTSDLAKAIHTDLHERLAQGEHIINVQSLAKIVEENPTKPELLLQLEKCPPNMICISNAGRMTFSGSYPCGDQLIMNQISFLAGCDQYYKHENNVTLNVVTFRERFDLSLSFLKELFDKTIADAILEKMEALFNSLSTVESSSSPNEVKTND